MSVWAARIEEGVDYLARHPWAALPVLLVVSAISFLPGLNVLPILEGGEPSYLVGARAMLETGDLATIQVQSAGWTAYLAARGGFWLSALSSGLVGISSEPWAYRLPAAMAAVLTPVAIWWAAMGLLRPRGAVLAGLLMASIAVLGLQARLAMPDTALVLFYIVAAGALARLYQHGGVVWATVFWCATATAFLARGPAAPLVLVGAALLLTQRPTFRLSTLRSSPGLMVLGGAVALWLIVCLVAWGGGQEYLSEAERQRLGMSFASEAPPGTYLLLSPLLFGPAILFAILGMSGISGASGRPATAFALLLAGPAWLLAEFWPDKQPHFILMALPALALLVAEAVDRDRISATGLGQIPALAALVWPPFLAVAMPASFVFFMGHMPWLAFPWLVPAALLGPVVWMWLREGHAIAALVAAIAAAILVYGAAFTVILPGYSGLRVAERIDDAAHRAVSCDNPGLAVAGYPEESVVFIAGRDTLLSDGAAAADALDKQDCAVAAVDRSQISAFRQRADDLGLDLVNHEQIVGLNLRRLIRVEIHVFSSAEVAR